MFKSIVSLLICFFCLPALAASKAFFSNDKSKVAILIQGPEGDLDGINLFNSMNTPVDESDSLLEKQVSFLATPVDKVFELSCRTSKIIPNSGSCTLIIYASNFSLFYPETKYLLMGINDSIDAKNAARKFNITDKYGYIFTSSDNQLNITAQKNADDKIISFTITYRELTD